MRSDRQAAFARLAGLGAVRLAGLVAGLGVGGCADFARGEYWLLDDAATETGTDGELGYAADIHPLLDAGCERCHGPGNSAEQTAFIVLSDDTMASYASTLVFVDLDNPGDSRLLGKTAGNGHGGGTIFDDRSAEYELILTWIEQGAPP